MSPAVESSDPHRLTRELIERNSRFVPEAIRADYFREMLHMTVLPQHDELLKILVALHFLSIIIGEAPDRITSEREKLDELLSGTVHAIQAAQTASISYQKHLEERLANLPTDLAKEINLNSIAESIKESLRQQFLSSGIPETAHALAVVSKEINQATSDFHRTARQLAVSCSNAADEASQAIESVRLALSGTTDAANHASESLRRSVLREYRWTAFAVCAVVLAIGFALGILCDHGISARLQNPQRVVTPTIQPAPPTQKLPVSTSKHAHRKTAPPSVPAEASSPGSKQ